MTTTESASIEAKTKTGTEVKGKDVVYLNAPEILLRQDADLPHTDKRELIAILNELFQSGGEGDDDWQPPEDWLPVPEPEANEIYFLLEVIDVTANYDKKFEFYVGRPKDGFTGYGQLTVDWGDGTVESWAGMQSDDDYNSPENHYGHPSHTYASTGQYLVKVTVSEDNRFLNSVNDSRSNGMPKLLIAKLGSNVIMNNEDYVESGSTYYGGSGFNGCYRLHYISFYGKLPRNSGFNNCQALRKVDNKTPITVVYNYTFNYCTSLAKLDFSAVENIGSSAFYYSGITQVNAPKCAIIGNYAFSNCQSLKSISAPVCTSIVSSAFLNACKLEHVEFAENCTFGANCFANCYSLYPRPDGSIK